MTAWSFDPDERERDLYRVDPSVVANPVRIIKRGKPSILDLEEDLMTEPVKVKVKGQWSVFHDGNRYVDGDTVTVPEDVAEEWERNHWVERVGAGKAKS